MRSIIVGLVALLVSLTCRAQDAERARTGHEIFQQCEQAYTIGQFEEARQTLKDNLNKFDGTLRISALRLLALCSMQLDDSNAADAYTTLLLKEEPFYSTAREEDQRFIDMVEQKKNTAASVSSASHMSEKLSEVPVPTTLITEEMIKMSGARTLAELLSIYVPGVSRVEGAEEMVTLHGAYTLFQEKILVLLNGHRLNSHTTNSESLDLRNSLDKVKQIEVLRGPASALYGNVALTAVVNIITKQGRDVDGVQLKAGAGNFGTYQASIVFGKQFVNVGFMAWATLSQSNGERFNVSPGNSTLMSFVNKPCYMYLGRVNESPSYDVGITAKYNKLSMMFTYQKSKKTMPYSSLLQFAPYDYDAYTKMFGIKPGVGRENVRLELMYEDQWKDLFWQTKGYVETEKASAYFVCGDSLDALSAYLFREIVRGTGPVEPEEEHPYAYTALQWHDYTWGVTGQLGYKYAFGKQSGTVIVGTQVERFVMNDTQFMIGWVGLAPRTFPEESRVLLLGNEMSAAGYLQLKHYFLPNLILNGSLRFDYKREYDDKKVRAWSPRATLIWTPHKNFTMKGSYAHSFVDAPYLYRANKTWIFGAIDELMPEELDATQFSFGWTLPSIGLHYELNVFYNSFRDLISFQQQSVTNAGSFRIAGLEHSLRFKKGRHFATANVTWQKMITSSNYTADDSHVYAVPSIFANAVYKFNVFKDKPFGALDLHANLNFTGKVYFEERTGYDPTQIQDKTLDPYIVCNAGLDYRWRFAELSFNLYNIFNTRYYRTGYPPLAIPEQSRHFMLTLKFNVR